MPLFVEASELSWNVRTVLDKKDMSAWSRTATILNEVALAGRTKPALRCCFSVVFQKMTPGHQSAQLGSQAVRASGRGPANLSTIGIWAQFFVVGAALGIVKTGCGMSSLASTH